MHITNSDHSSGSIKPSHLLKTMEKANHSSFSSNTFLSKCDNSSFQDSNHRKMNGLKLPSYVGISCAISGYSGYSKYCSSARGSMSRGSSPMRLSEMLVDDHFSKLKKQSNLETRLASDQVDFIKSDLLINQGDSEYKSLVQQRIESLYGQSFADCWRDSRSKQKLVKSKAENAKRSPSCPPHALVSKDVKKNLAVFNHLTKDFINQLDADQKTSQVLNGNLNEANKVNGQTNQEKLIDLEQVKDAREVSEVKNGRWYLNQLDQTCSKITKQVEIIEGYLRDESHMMNEEVLGIVRLSLGKANLLMSQKLKQFRELCLKNINHNSNDEFETRNQDLEGFWEMVYIQVENIFKTFDQINSMKENKWQFKELTNNLNAKTKPLRKTLSSKLVAPKTGKSLALDELRKTKLKEAKEKQAAKLQELKGEEIMIFTSSADDVINNS